MKRASCLLVVLFGVAAVLAQQAAENVTIQLTAKPAAPAPAPPPPPGFTARFTPEDLQAILREQINRLPLPMQTESERGGAMTALDRINMGALLDALTDYLKTNFAGRFDPALDVIVTPVPKEKQVIIDTPDRAEKQYVGPAMEISGFMVHGLGDAEFISIAVRVMQTARQMLDSGNPLYDRGSPDYYRKRAETEARIATKTEQDEAALKKDKAAARKRVAQALGLQYDEATGEAKGDPKWLKESRRFTYVIKDGKFIERLRPLVDAINKEMNLAGFQPPWPLDRAGVYFDPDIKNVDVVLPKPMVQEFLDVADSVERRMAEDFIISIEAVRLTDRDIVTGALASRINASVQGVHDTQRFRTSNVIRELGLNSLLAVANQQLQISTLSNVAAGAFPAGVAPVVIAPPTLPPANFLDRPTTVGSTFAVGADDIFFDGRQQSTGFSYVTPDGIEHRLSFEVVDSLRQFWDRIERNLIVHKIKKTDKLTPFTVPVGPQSKTYNGIAALISQEDQQLIVATGTGAISQISATAGTWLVIEDFQISPIPGSSTALTEEELRTIDNRVALTMMLRDPNLDVETKRRLMRIESSEALHAALEAQIAQFGNKPATASRSQRTYAQIFDKRRRATVEDAAVEKKEKNSSISLNFFSSQGNIVQQPGSTQLGSANDLTSFTTELKPNNVTPISSFLTKSGSSAQGSSPLTGIAKGERTDQTKTMTHLLIRARFPTSEREQRDLVEGRHMGYFSLPLSKESSSKTEVPMLSSSEHPLDRLAKLRIGLMFETLQPDRVRDNTVFLNPNKFPGSVPRDVFEAATTRLLMARKLITDSPGRDKAIAADYVERFKLSVRSLLEYDEDFFDAPNLALQNLSQWNDPDAVAVALNASPGRFALQNLVEMLDDLGERLIPQDYADNYLARAEKEFLGPTRLYNLTFEELRALRRDVAAHLLRFENAYGDAFLEGVSAVLQLGSYRLDKAEMVEESFLKGRTRLAIFNQGGELAAAPERVEAAHADFLLLKRGGYKGRLFERSFLGVNDMSDAHRQFVIVGTEALRYADDWKVYDY